LQTHFTGILVANEYEVGKWYYLYILKHGNIYAYVRINKLLFGKGDTKKLTEKLKV